MDAIQRTRRPWTLIGNRPARFRIPVAQSIAVALAAGLLGIAIVIFARRVSGAFENSLSDIAFVASLLAAAVWAAAIRLSTAKAGHDGNPKWFRRFLDWTPTVALPLVGVALAVEGTSITAVLLAAVIIAGEEYWAVRLASRPTPRSKAGKQSRLVVGRAAEARFNSREGDAKLVAPAFEPAVAIDTKGNGDLWQEQRRYRDEYQETVTGLIRTQFFPRERVAIEHVAFCPPLVAVPHLELEPVDGCECCVRATHVFRYGARIEVKLEQALDEATECLVAFEARTTLGARGVREPTIPSEK
jgi:hypothetical protein